MRMIGYKLKKQLYKLKKQLFFEAHMKTGHVLPLLCTSLVCFLYLIILVFRFPGSALHTTVPLIIAAISFSGTIFTVLSMKPVSDRWYLGIPHVAAIGIVCIASAGMLFSWARNLEFLNLSLAFLALTSAGLFVAFPRPQRKMTRFFAIISGIIGIYSLYLIYSITVSILNPLQTSWSVIDVLSAIYAMFLLPVIGICYITAAIWEKIP